MRRTHDQAYRYSIIDNRIYIIDYISFIYILFFILIFIPILYKNEKRIKKAEPCPISLKAEGRPYRFIYKYAFEYTPDSCEMRKT